MRDTNQFVLERMRIDKRNEIHEVLVVYRNAAYVLSENDGAMSRYGQCKYWGTGERLGSPSINVPEQRPVPACEAVILGISTGLRGVFYILTWPRCED